MHKHHHKHGASAQPGPAQSTTPPQAAPSAGTHSREKVVSEEDIRLRAYRKWESAGKPTGDGVQFWLAAEQELVQGK